MCCSVGGRENLYSEPVDLLQHMKEASPKREKRSHTARRELRLFQYCLSSCHCQGKANSYRNMEKYQQLGVRELAPMHVEGRFDPEGRNL